MSGARTRTSSRTSSRDALFEAADVLLKRTPWSQISMRLLATRARVSRQTLYNEFGTRDEFAQAWVMRETERFIANFEAAVDGHHALRAALGHAFAVFLREAAASPTVRQIIVREPGANELLALFTTRGGPVLHAATVRLTKKILARWPHVNRRRAKLGAECLVRLAISHASLPSGRQEVPARVAGDLVGGFIDPTGAMCEASRAGSENGPSSR
jgi:AcrR family transcriptional regulator